MSAKASPVNKPLFILLAICSLAAVFYMPYFVPQAPSTSQSWIFGYNNRAGIELLLAAIAVGVFWTSGMGLDIASPTPAKPLNKRYLYGAIAVACCLTALMYILAGTYGGFEEANYEIDRVWLLDQGKQPYVDFEYAYGSGLLYGPMILQRLFRIAVYPAYYIFFFLTVLAGTWILFKLIGTCNYPSDRGGRIFLLMFVPGVLSILAMGTHYTFLRFASPLYFISVYHGMLSKAGTVSIIRSSLVAAFFSIVLILISPETALAFAFACSILYLLCAPSASRATRLAGTGLLLLVLGTVFGIAWHLQVLRTLQSAAGNANSFPIAIAPHILFYVTSLFLAGCYLYVRVAKREFSDRMIGLILVSIPMVAGALSRCDAGHVWWYGLGVIIAAMFVLSNSPTWFGRYQFAFLAFLVILPFLTGLVAAQPNLIRVFHLWKPAGFATVPANEISVDALFPSWKGDFLAPLGFSPNGYGTTHSPRIDFGRYEGTLNNDTAPSIQETISWIEDHPQKALLLPKGFHAFCTIDPRFERFDLGLLFAFPYFGRAVHTESLRRPLCDFIVDNYEPAQPPTEQTFNWGVWVRKSLARPPNISPNL